MTRFARFGHRNKKAHEGSKWEELKSGESGQRVVTEQPASENDFHENTKRSQPLKGVKKDAAFKNFKQNQKMAREHFKNKIQKGKGSKEFTKKDFSEIECYNCRQKGHKVSECPEPSDGKELEVQCYNCKEKGHKAFKCPKAVQGIQTKRHKMQKNTDRKKTDLRKLDKKQKEEWKAKRSEQRRKQRQKEAQAKLHCFNCRESGHKLSECPEIQKDLEQGTDICFKCGSTEHTVKQCRLKLAPGEYPYAKCFICGEMGHLSKKCPDNPRGLYPNGGCCKECGSVEHLQRDCPEFQRKQGIESYTLERLTAGNSADVEIENKGQTTKPVKRKEPKIVKF